MDTTKTPIFDLTDHFDTTIPLGDAQLPIKVKRFARAELEDFEKKLAKYIYVRGADPVDILKLQLRTIAKDGVVALAAAVAEQLLERVDRAPAEPRSSEEQANFDAETLAFFETSIRDAITIEEGYIRDRGHWITDGAGLIGVFHGRKDVLSLLVGAIARENRLSSLIKKNSNLPRASGGGSSSKTPAPNGDAPGSTATSAGNSVSAANGAATDGNDKAETDSRASSGSSDDATRVH